MCCVGDVERKFEEVVGHILKSSDDCEHVPPDAIIIETRYKHCHSSPMQTHLNVSHGRQWRH